MGFGEPSPVILTLTLSLTKGKGKDLKVKADSSVALHPQNDSSMDFWLFVFGALNLFRIWSLGFVIC